MVFRIETHVTAAAQQVDSGREQLQQAEKHKKSARRMKFILAAILAGVAIVLIILIAVYVISIEICIPLKTTNVLCVI